MGIEIDGKINNFEKELKKKGIIRDRQYDILPKEFFKSFRLYKGFFSHDFADFMVEFDKETKIVYQVKVLIKYDSLASLDEGYESYCLKLCKKYPKSRVLNKERNENDLKLAIPDSNFDEFVGIIIAKRTVEQEKDSYNLVLQYFDITSVQRNLE